MKKPCESCLYYKECSKNMYDAIVERHYGLLYNNKDCWSEEKVDYYSFGSKELERIAFEKTLKYDEHIACTNATVIVNDKGEITGWVDNDQPIQFIHED